MSKKVEPLKHRGCYQDSSSSKSLTGLSHRPPRAGGPLQGAGTPGCAKRRSVCRPDQEVSSDVLLQGPLCLLRKMTLTRPLLRLKVCQGEREGQAVYGIRVRRQRQEDWKTLLAPRSSLLFTLNHIILSSQSSPTLQIYIAGM